MAASKKRALLQRAYDRTLGFFEEAVKRKSLLVFDGPTHRMQVAGTDARVGFIADVFKRTSVVNNSFCVSGGSDVLNGGWYRSFTHFRAGDSNTCVSGSFLPLSSVIDVTADGPSPGRFSFLCLATYRDVGPVLGKFFFSLVGSRDVSW